MIRKNILSLIFSVIIAYFSLANSDSLDEFSFVTFSDFDKIAHFTMYFGLMSLMLFENRTRLSKAKVILLLGIIPFIFGFILELLQSWITTSRTGSIYDLLFNLAGILFSIASFLAARRFGRENFRY
ncbi:MAG: VanZ family protein [Bacteroidales bacterium]|nr:VanZ family protein [Bacteroidales bacterium]